MITCHSGRRHPRFSSGRGWRRMPLPPGSHREAALEPKEARSTKIHLYVRGTAPLGTRSRQLPPGLALEVWGRVFPPPPRAVVLNSRVCRGGWGRTVLPGDVGRPLSWACIGLFVETFPLSSFSPAVARLAVSNTCIIGTRYSSHPPSVAAASLPLISPSVAGFFLRVILCTGIFNVEKW